MNFENIASKSVARGTFDETFIEDGFFVLTYKNENDTVQILEREIDSTYIQFHFCSKGSADFVFNRGSYTLNPSMAVVLNQLISFNLNVSIKSLYFKGKVYELLSLYFNRNEDADIEQCPFLVDEVNVAKLKKAKDIIVGHMAEPPSLKDLAQEVDLSLKKLKEGFKQVYGDTVYGFLFDYKMEVARKLLESGDYNVNEVGLRVGYSTASHFIAAFKKKFGTTPKKYLTSLKMG